VGGQGCPESVKELQPQLIRARAQLSQQMNRAPTAPEVAQHLGVAREIVIEATIGGGNYSTKSTDMAVGTGDHDSQFGDTLGGR